MTKPTVLIVDDDDSLRECLAVMLRGAFFVVTADCVEKADHVLHSVHVDAVLSDYNIGSERLPDLAEVLLHGMPIVGMSGDLKCNCELPSALAGIPWIEKGALKMDHVRDTLMEAMNG